MIGISRGLGALGLPLVPAGTPAAAPAAAGAVAGAVDAAFADLTAALLATAAGAGQPAMGKGATSGAVAVPAKAPGTGDDASMAATAVTVPVVVPVPTPVGLVPTAPVEGAAGDTVTDTPGAGGTTEGAASPAVAAAFTAGAPPAGGAAISSEILGGEDIRERWVDETFQREAGESDGGDRGPVGTPFDPILPEGLRRQAAPLPASPVAPTPVASTPAGGETRQGSSAPAITDLATPAPTPAPAATNRPTTAATGTPAAATVARTSTADTPVPAPTETPVPTAIEPATTPVDTPPAPVTSGLARRAEALQRALGRRAEAEHGDHAPAGLTTQAARPEAAIAATVMAETPTNGQGAHDGGEAASQQRRAVRMAAAAAPIATAPVTAGVAERPTPHEPVASASAPNWRAAAMAARFAEPASTAGEAPRQGAAPVASASFAAAVAAELAAPREARPAVIEAPVSLPHEPAGAEHVQMQIVKSMKLQWTGATQEARVQLKPEYLGEVVANIKVEQGVVTATLHADTPEVRRMLETQTASLREALVEHGLKLDKVVIAEPETPSGQQGDRRSRGRQPQPESRPKPRRARDGGDGATFELSTE